MPEADAAPSEDELGLRPLAVYVDGSDNVIGFDDVLNPTRRFHDFCRAEGTPPLDLDY
jgi:hypothetical protein